MLVRVCSVAPALPVAQLLQLGRGTLEALPQCMRRTQAGLDGLELALRLVVLEERRRDLAARESLLHCGNGALYLVEHACGLFVLAPLAFAAIPRAPRQARGRVHARAPHPSGRRAC
jgi:hypothetical protein